MQGRVIGVVFGALIRAISGWLTGLPPNVPRAYVLPGEHGNQHGQANTACKGGYQGWRLVLLSHYSQVTLWKWPIDYWSNQGSTSRMGAYTCDVPAS